MDKPTTQKNTSVNETIEKKNTKVEEKDSNKTATKDNKTVVADKNVKLETGDKDNIPSNQSSSEVNSTTKANKSATNTNSPKKTKAIKKNKFKTKQTKSSFSEFSEKVVNIKRISKTTKGGRAMRFSVLVVIGDKKGRVGYGMGKSIEIPNAMKKAIKTAKNNLTQIIMDKKGTVFHEVIGKSCAAKVLIKPAKEGTGIVAGGAIRAVFEAAGFRNVYTKNLGKNTPVNMIQAAINGLKAQKTPTYIANMRDKKVSEL